MSNIEYIVSYGQSLIGLTADPSTPWRQLYLDLIAPSETPQHQAGMATLYNCELLCRAILRRFIQHPLLDAPYRDGHAGMDLMAIARESAALRPLHALPQAGDIVIVAKPEHAWFVLGVASSTYDGAVLYDGLDGLEVDGFRAVATRQHTVRDGRDDAGGDRAIVAVIDTCVVVRAFGRSDGPIASRAPVVDGLDD